MRASQGYTHTTKVLSANLSGNRFLEFMSCKLDSDPEAAFFLEAKLNFLPNGVSLFPSLADKARTKESFFPEGTP